MMSLLYVLLYNINLCHMKNRLLRNLVQHVMIVNHQWISSRIAIGPVQRRGKEDFSNYEFSLYVVGTKMHLAKLEVQQLLMMLMSLYLLSCNIHPYHLRNRVLQKLVQLYLLSYNIHLYHLWNRVLHNLV